MFILNVNDPTPLYKQLYDQTRKHILSGQLTAHSRLQSVRQLSFDLSVSRNTVDGAYQELLAEGYIYSKPRSGYYVSSLDQGNTVPLDRINSQPPIPNSSQSLRYRYSFHPAKLDKASFPTTTWKKCYTEGLHIYSREISEYGFKGLYSLRSSLQKYLEHSRGVICEPDQIVICSGLQQSLNIVAGLLGANHSTVGVENPGYSLPRSIFTNHYYKICPIAVSEYGIELDNLKSSNSTIVYITPSHQMPMGAVMPIANRLNLIDWSESQGNFILEDDYDSELRYHGKPIPSLQGLHPDGNIIYIGSFSKILSPGLRISYMVLPKSLLDIYHNKYQGYFSSVSALEQLALTSFIDNGHWDRQVRRMRIMYQKKHDEFIRAIEENFQKEFKIIGKGAGLHMVLELPTCKISEKEIIFRAKQKDLELLPFSYFYATANTNSTKLILGFGGEELHNINTAVALLSQIISLQADN